MKKEELIQLIKIVTLGLVIGVGVSFVSSAQWAPPTPASSTNNTSGPLNVGTSQQTVSGGLTVNYGFSSLAPAEFDDSVLINTGGNVTQNGVWSGHPIRIFGSTTTHGAQESFDVGSDTANNVSYLQAQQKLVGQNLSSIFSLNPTGGNVGIGTVTPASALSVVGNIWSYNLYGGSLGGSVCADINGKLTLCPIILNVNATGTGTGHISSASFASCGSNCSYNFTYGTSIDIAAVSNSDSSFSSWTGCDSTSASHCKITMNGSRTITAYFNKN